MTAVRVDKNRQVIIPVSVYERTHISEGDVLDVEIKDGSILMVPRENIYAVERPAKDSQVERWFGAAKGIFGSTEEIDEHIRKERASWD